MFRARGFEFPLHEKQKHEETKYVSGVNSRHTVVMFGKRREENTTARREVTSYAALVHTAVDRTGRDFTPSRFLERSYKDTIPRARKMVSVIS